MRRRTGNGRGRPPKDNPGTTVTTGWVRMEDKGVGWKVQPAQDYDKVFLDNGFFEIFIPDPISTMKYPKEWIVNPEFWR